ncbi:MAG: tRNA (adenosine(37)-N6)-dimethylallyltransferase MiaA [Acidimicrobiales bacterium]
MAGAQGSPVVLVGTTASGKSDLALEVARGRLGVEIVSVDSMSVYRGMDIATAKPSAAERSAVRHHLVDIVDPSEEFTVSMFQTAARAALDEIAGRGGLALLVGGTGLYVRSVVDDLALPGRFPGVAAGLEIEADRPGGLALLHERLAGLDPIAAARVTAGNRRRIVRALEVTIGSGRPFSSFGPGLGTYPPTRFTLIGIPFDAAEVDRRIETRLSAWMEHGLLDEVLALAAWPGGLSRTARQALGYKELLDHLEGSLSLDEALRRAGQRTRAFARRQWAWFRRDPRIRWLDPQDEPTDVVTRALDARRSASEVRMRD